jgi:hypothetical protein
MSQDTSRSRLRLLDDWLLGGRPGHERFTSHAAVLLPLLALGLVAAILAGGRLTPSGSAWLGLPGQLAGLVIGRLWVRRIDRR